MESAEKLNNGKKEIGGSSYLNRNCWLVKNLNYAPYKRCQYCEYKFRNCLFLQYQVISLFLIVFIFLLFLLIDKTISALVVITVFALVIIYGYFFNNSTEKIIKANFFQKKAKDALKELTDHLEQRVGEQTKDIQEKAVRLEKLLKMRSEFLDIASHQLRTPTSVIKGTLSMMKEGDMEKMPVEEKTRFIEGMFQKSVKLEGIIDDILVASEMDTANFDIKAEDKIELDKFVEKAVSEHQFDAQEKKLALTFEKLSNGPFKIKGSAKYLEQVIDNLLNNALKYTPQGSISTTIKNDEQNVIVAVKDTGIGIPKTDVGKIFNKFIRGQNARNVYTDGSGLGLFIIKRVMDQHPGSKVWVESEEGKGSTFYLQFPLLK
ncbi:MAG: HAMP domain-containing sensor histidine kinase [Candidatus Komeilibacteria bacterium]|nr:HAMP domain-containing sensor histidine kinase [Candidatus Komeilibacteria bacterium]